MGKAKVSKLIAVVGDERSELGGSGCRSARCNQTTATKRRSPKCGQGKQTHRNAVRVLLADTLGLGLALLEGVLVLELASHFGGVGDGGGRC